MRVSNKGLYPKRKPPLFRGGHYFKNLEESYKVLMNKEFKFCLKNRDKIQKNVEKIYKKQKERNIIGYGACNFSKLEQVMLKWNKIE